jgi:signal transduction histidine kinase
MTTLSSSQSTAFPADHYASLLAGLIHKSNNIITVLSGHTGLLLLEPNLSEDILQPLRRMSHAAELLSRYINEARLLTKATILTLFDPFFTTRPQKGKFGLGLFRARGELARMGGEISARSDDKTYTEILIRIPAA